MLNTVKKMIERVDYFACGYCTNDLKRVFKGFDKTIVNFNAGVFLIKHREKGYILYDTGYSVESGRVGGGGGGGRGARGRA